MKNILFSALLCLGLSACYESAVTRDDWTGSISSSANTSSNSSSSSVGGNSSTSSSSSIVNGISSSSETGGLSIKGQTFSIPENKDSGFVIGTLSVSNPNSEVLSFSIQNGNNSNAFYLDPITGKLSTSKILDFEATPSHSLLIRVSNGKTYSEANVNISVTDSNSGTFLDSRDGQSYKWVEIGSQIWMAQNLNFLPNGKDQNGAWCYNNDNSNCQKYGRLYDWNTTMNSAPSSNSTPSGVQGVCPKGWHVPSDQEIESFAEYLSQFTGLNAKYDDDWGLIGKVLKSNSTLWTTNTGTDLLGFGALPSGYFSNPSFDWKNMGCYLWSSTEVNSTTAFNRTLGYDGDYLGRTTENKTKAFSLRCLKD